MTNQIACPSGGEGEPCNTNSITENIVTEIATERRRQIAIEGWTAKHDDAYTGGELPRAAACYALGECPQSDSYTHPIWPWSDDWWKPRSDRENLIRAGALIAAEIERLDRIRDRALLEHSIELVTTPPDPAVGATAHKDAPYIEACRALLIKDPSPEFKARRGMVEDLVTAAEGMLVELAARAVLRTLKDLSNAPD